METVTSLLGGRLEVVAGSITEAGADAIVNAAGEDLSSSGGVDRAIREAGGPRLVTEMKHAWAAHGGRLEPGGCLVTGAGALPAKHVIHVRGPRWGREQGRENELLANCYRWAIIAAGDLGCRSIAFPSISTGAYRFPPTLAAQISAGAIAAQLAQTEMLVVLVFAEREQAELFCRYCELGVQL